MEIHDIVIKAGQVTISHILFLHVWNGCDTTSATFKHGKNSLLKRINESKEIQQISSLLSEHNATEEQIGKAGIKLFVPMYGGKLAESLNSLRCIKFMEMISSKASLDPQKPPLQKEFHIITVYRFTYKILYSGKV